MMFDIVIGNPPYIQLQKNGGYLAHKYRDVGYKVFRATGDIYCLFYERGLRLLRRSGVLCYITSDKWLRSNYGEGLREYLSKEYNPKLLICLGADVFIGAKVDVSIILIKKEEGVKELLTVKLSNRKDFYKAIKHGVNIKIGKDIWFIGSEDEQRLKEKIERIGKPLRDWDIRIYSGILTGLNEAFIISSEKKEEILNNCRNEVERKRTEEIIKPVLRGRDIDRYYYRWAGLWVILIPVGWTNKNREDEDPETFINSYYYSLMNHLNQFKERAIRRSVGGDYWWELSGSIFSSFNEWRVSWQRVTRNCVFCLTDPNICLLDTVGYIVGSHLYYIMAVCNSRLINKYARMIAQLRGVKWFELLNQYVECFPIPAITFDNQFIVSELESLTRDIVSLRVKGCDTSNLEEKINYLVYKLYDLTQKEIDLIELQNDY